VLLADAFTRHLPTDIPPVNQTAQWLFTLGQIPPLILTVALAFRYARRHATAVPLLLLAGGGFAALIEPIVDRNALVWFPAEGQWSVYTAYGVPQPLWLVMAYFWFFGGQALVVWALMRSGWAGRRVWWMFAGIVGVDVILEHAGLWTDLFFYFGPQPFDLTGFPLWAGAVNASIPIVMATVVMLVESRLPGRRLLLVVPLFPAVQAAVNAWTQWPLWDTLNSETTSAVVWAGGAATIGFAVLAVYLCSLRAVSPASAASSPERTRTVPVP
jgi:hypothetical protein